MAPAQQPLFSWVDRTVLQRRSTRCFLALFKYYHAQTGVEERLRKGERAEQWEFLNVMYNLQLTYTQTPLRVQARTYETVRGDLPSSPR